MPMLYAFPGRRRMQSPSKKTLFLAQISRSGSRKSRRAWAHLRKPLRGFDVCSDRKSTRLNSSHDQISYAVFCLKKKKYSYGIKQQTERAAYHVPRAPED